MAEIEIQPVTPASAHDRYGDIITALSELTQVLAIEESMEESLQRILVLAMRLIPGCHAASITVLDDSGMPKTIVATDDDTFRLDQGQYQLDDGPCLDAARRHTINRCDVEAAEQVWPRFTEIAKSMGLRSYLSAGLVVEGHPLGALNLSSREPAGFDALDEAFISMFSTPVASAIAGRDRYQRTSELAVNLERAMDSRAVIDRAIGIVMAQARCDADVAFERLRTASNNQNIKLREIAARVVEQVPHNGNGSRR
ncbi:GAF and ANTAR domain-containing protein [Salinactinospora qingdaonensis]|uniref:ANTAR domain-containing protein n=1 Tax=Salinactinospora qingdaonensis TaxID=702744 RepID=A0ABP7F3P4_9ACTN